MAFYKTRKTETINVMQKMQWTWWMLIRILRNLLKDFIEFCHFNIPGECLRRFREIFYRIPGNVLEDSGECLKRFLGVFRKIPENVKTKFREMVENISINVTKDSKECYLRFLKLCFFIKFLQNTGAIYLMETVPIRLLITYLLSLIVLLFFLFLPLSWGKDVTTVKRGMDMKKL